MLLLKWQAYSIEMKIIESSSLWFYNLNKNINSLSSILQIFLKNSSLRNNVNIKLLSYYLFIYSNFNIYSKITNTKKNIISYKIRKNSPRGLLVHFKKSSNLKLLKFLNYQNCKVMLDTKLSSSMFIGNINKIFDSSKYKAFIINEKQNNVLVKSNFKLRNTYKYSFGLNLYFMKKFNIFTKESYYLLNQIKLWNNFMKFNNIIGIKLILNKNFSNNLIINSTFNENFKQKNYNFFNYSHFKLLNKEDNNNLIYLKGKTKLKNMNESSLLKLIAEVNSKKDLQKIGFLLYNKRVYRIFYFLNFYNSIVKNQSIIKFFIIFLIKTVFNFFDLTQFTI